MHATRLTPIAATFLLLLTACDGGGGTPSPSVSPSASPIVTPSVSPSVTPVVTPSVTPTPVFGPHPPLSGLRITTRGLLPLTHSDPIVGNAGEDMLEWDDMACYSEVMGITEDTGRWVANSDYYPSDVTGSPPFGVDTSPDGAVHRIDIISPDIYTPNRVHIGTLLPDLTVKYPFLVTGTPGYQTNVYWVVDAHGFVVFETNTQLPDGTPVPEYVERIRILSADWGEPDWTVYGTENFAEACF